MIYFISQENDKYVKIGYSSGMGRKRLAAMQTGNPHRLSLLAVFEGDEDRERELHKYFKADRIRGEWFHYSEDIHLCIRNNGEPVTYKMTKPQVDEFVKDNDLWGDVILLQHFR